MTNAKETIMKKGSAAAAMISVGIGSLFLGIFTTGAVISSELKEMLKLYGPTGPLSGKTTFAVVIWLLSWWYLNSRWGGKDYDLDKAFRTLLILLGIALVLTFPPAFEAFE